MADHTDPPLHQTDDRSERSVAPVDVTSIVRFVVVVLAAVVVVRAVGRLDQILGLVLAAGVLALVTLPMTDLLARRLRGFGVAVTAVVSMTVALVVGYTVLRDLSTQSASIAERIGDRLAEIDSSTTFGRVVSSLRVGDAITAWLNRVPELVVVGEETGSGISRQLIALVTVVILAAFLQSSGRRILDWFVSRWPRVGDDADDGGSATEPRHTVREILHDIDRRALGMIRRTLALGTAVGIASSIVLGLLDVPGAVVLATWMAVWFVVPTVGWIVGLAPLAAIAWIDGGWSLTVAVAFAAVVAVAVTVLRRRLVDQRTIRLGVGLYVLGVATGVAMGGVAGSIIGLTVAAIVTAVVTTTHDIPRPARWHLPSGSVRTLAGATIPAGWRGAVTALAAAGLGAVMWIALLRSVSAIVWILIGSFVAVALSRPVAWIERRTGAPRRVAIGGLLLFILAVVMTLAITSASEVGTSTTVADRLPEVAEDLESSPVVGSWLRDADAALWIENQVEDLPQRVQRLQPAEFLPTVGARLLDLFWTAVIAVALLIDGRRLVDRTVAIVPAAHRRQFGRLVSAIGSALGGYAAGAALVAGINGAVVFGIAVALGIALAPLLGIWAFTWNFVPQIGGFIGGVPLILFALLAGPLQALIASAAFVIYQFVENNLIQPTVIGAAIDVPPWGTLVAAIAGAAAGGVIGAVLVTPLVGVVRVVRGELARDDFPGSTMAERSPDVS